MEKYHYRYYKRVGGVSQAWGGIKFGETRYNMTRLRDIRETLGLKPEEVARLTGISSASLWQYERGTTAPEERTKTIADALGVTIEELCPEGGQIATGRGGQLSYRNRSKLAGLDEAMRRKGWSQARLAAALGVSETAVRGWRTLRTRPSGNQVVRIASMLNVTRHELVHGFANTDSVTKREDTNTTPPQGEQIALTVATAEQTKTPVQMAEAIERLVLEVTSLRTEVRRWQEWAAAMPKKKEADNGR